MHILAEIALLDPAGGERVTVRAASAEDRAITGLGGKVWWPAITKKPSLGLKLFDGAFLSPIDAGTATFTVSSATLARAATNYGTLRWAGASVTLYAGDSGDAWPWTEVFHGTVDQFQHADGRTVVTAKVDTSPFDADVLADTYAGTGDAEGGADLKDRPKPLILGRARNVEPVLINADDGIYQFSAYGPVAAVQVLYERGSDFGASVGDYADYAALLAADIPAGRWGTCLAEGLVRLGAPAYGVITGDVKGDAAGGYKDRTGAIIKRAAAIAGVSASLLDGDSLDALDTACPYPIGIVLSEQTSLIDLARRLVLPLNAQAGVSWLGKLFATRIAIGSPKYTLDGQGRQRPPVTSVTEADVSPPFKRIQFGAQRCWRVHTFDEIAFEAPLIDRGAYSAATTYREGNIVTIADGSRWLYTATVPSAGNAPAEGSAFWQRMTTAPTLADMDPDAMSAIDAAAALAAGKSTIFYRSTPPTAADSQAGDLWINSADGNRAYRRVAGSGRLAIGGNRITLAGNYITLPWVLADDQRIAEALTAAAGAQATADGKVTTFSQEAQPTATGRGDLWYKPSEGSLRRWTGAQWIEVSTVGATAAEAADIAASKAAVAAIASDDVLSRGEKPQFAREWQQAQARYAAIDAKAATFGNVATERAALTSAYDALDAAIDAISPAYNNVGADSDIDGDALNGKWADFYTAYAALDMAITAQTIAVEWSADGETDWHETYGAGDKWQRQSIDGGATWGAAVKVVGEDGADGADGEQGPQGIQGPAGSDGQSLYTWVAYANSADGSTDFTTGNPGSRAYIGLAPNKTTATEGSDPAAYTWSKIVGPQGPKGDQGDTGDRGPAGEQGPAGVDGQSLYTWIAYADSADGTVNFTTGGGGTRTYIGIANNKASATEGNNPAAYTWSKIKGDQGVAGTPGADGQPTYTWFAYADSADGTVNFTTGASGNRTYLGLAANKSTATESTNPADYFWSKIQGPPGDQGIQGEQGVQGPPGEDGTPRYIWIAYANSADGTVDFTNGNPGTRTYIGVAPNKLTATESSTPGDYSWAKIEGPQGAAGADGADGADGIDGQHTSFVFRRAATQPATPTSATTPPDGWSDAPPIQTDPPLPLWQSRADFRNAAKLTAWSTPIKLIAASLADLDPDAATLLQQAKDIADGKNRIWRQDTAPSAAESQPNDIWINTAAGNRTLVRVVGSGRLAIGADTITLGGSYITLPWIESPDAQLGQALADASAAIAKANLAQIAADRAIESIEALADDGLLTAAEKITTLIPRDAALDGAWSILDDQAAALSITTERTAASGARTAWQTLRDSLSPAWNDTTADTPVNRATFRSTLSAYEDALAALQSAISAEAAKRAEYEHVSGIKPPTNADNTAENQHLLTQPQPIVIHADYTGAIEAGQLPVQRLATRTLGDTDVSADTDYSVTATDGLTVSINNTPDDVQRGTVTLSALTVASGTITIFSAYGGLTLFTTLSVTRQDAAPPAGGGGGGSGDPGAAASTSSFTPNSTATHQPICGALEVTVGSSGEVKLTAPLTYHATSEGAIDDTSTTPTTTIMAVKWQYSTGGGWTDIGSETAGTFAESYFRLNFPKGLVDNPGYLNAAETASSLSAGTVQFRLVGRMTAGEGIASITGTATATPQ